MKKIISVVVLGFSLGCGLVLTSAIKTTAPSDMFSKYTNGLPDNIKVKTTFEDATGNLWLGSLGNGLWERLAETTDFKNIITIPNRNNIDSIYQSKDSSIWVGGDMGLYAKSSTAGAFAKVESGLPVDIEVESILEDASNNILLGSWNSGLWEKASGSDNFVQITSGLPSGILIFKIYEDSSNNLWLGSIDNGLWEKASGSDSFVNIINIPNTKEIYSIYQSKDGSIWVGGDMGLYTKSSTAGAFAKVESGLPTIAVNTIYEDENYNLLLGGGAGDNHGLWEKASGSDSFVKITSGLPNDIVIHNITEDSSHSLWVSSENGLYVSNSGVGYNLSQGATSTTYNDGTNNWILSNKAITFWARGSNITSININGASYSTGEFSLDGTNYQSSGGRYQITVTYSGGKPTEKYYFGIKNSIVSDLGFATLSGDKLETYTGYLFGDKTRAVKVEYVYDPNFASQAVLNMHLENEYIINWSQTYLQQLDTTSLKPIGDKIALSASSESVNKDGLYQLVITDKLGNSEIYYIQVGNKTKIIPDTPTPINPSNPTNMAWWEILLIVLGVIGGFLLLFFIYARTHMYLTIDRHNKKAHQKPKEKKTKLKK